MTMGKRPETPPQQEFWVETRELPQGPGHPFYERLAQILEEAEFDDFVESECARFYAEKLGRPSLAPAIYFRLLMVGFFEGIDSERGIAWRVADSITLRHFLGLELTSRTPDHSTISRNRRLIDLEAHQAVFGWVVARLAESGLVRGKTLGIDATTLEANAAMRSIVRRDTGESYQEFLEGLAKASGIESPTRADLAKLDKKRKKKTSNKDWENPNDPDSRVTKMKDGRTHMAHKVEHAVDMETGAVLGITVQPADRGDTTSQERTLEEAVLVLEDVFSQPEAADGISEYFLTEVVADKGYHSNAVMTSLAAAGIRTYISEPDRGRRNWKGKEAERDAVYSNRRRIRGNRGKRLLRRRGELIERSFAHAYETGGMRRTHLRVHENITKRLLVHLAGLNLSLLMRTLFGSGTPRALRAAVSALIAAFDALKDHLNTIADRSLFERQSRFHLSSTRWPALT